MGEQAGFAKTPPSSCSARVMLEGDGHLEEPSLLLLSSLWAAPSWQQQLSAARHRAWMQGAARGHAAPAVLA